MNRFPVRTHCDTALRLHLPDPPGDGVRGEHGRAGRVSCCCLFIVTPRVGLWARVTFDPLSITRLPE